MCQTTSEIVIYVVSAGSGPTLRKRNGGRAKENRKEIEERREGTRGVGRKLGHKRLR